MGRLTYNQRSALRAAHRYGHASKQLADDGSIVDVPTGPQRAAMLENMVRNGLLTAEYAITRDGLARLFGG